MEQALPEGAVLEQEEDRAEAPAAWEEWEARDKAQVPAVSVYVRPVELLRLTRQVYPATKSSVPNVVAQWFESSRSLFQIYFHWEFLFLIPTLVDFVGWL